MKSNTRYWAERQLQTQQKLTDKSIKSTEKQLVKYYKHAREAVIEQFEATYNKLLLAVGEGKKPTPADLYKLDKYWQMQGQISKELQKLGDSEAALFNRQFIDQYQTIYNSVALKSGESFNKISNENVQQMINEIWCADGESWSQRIWKNTDKLHEELNSYLIDCVVTGRTPDYLKKELMQRFDVAYRRADCIVRTEMAHLQTEAAKKRYQDYGIKEVEVLVDVDERTCPICAKHEGERYPINGKMPVPFHPNCRCCVIPVVDDLII